MINVFPKNIEQPYLLCSNCYLWSITGITKSISFFKPKCLKEILFWNGGLQGCAMMFNAELRTRIVNTFHNHIGMHDLLLSLTAFAFGKVQYISEELFLYRSHPNSITNSNPSKSKKEYVLNGMCHKSVPVIMKKAYNDIQTFYENYKEMLKENDKKVICKYLLLVQKNSLQRFFSILFSDFSLKGSHFNLVIKVLIRPFFM
jgi:rhamnosyltransferase